MTGSRKALVRLTPNGSGVALEDGMIFNVAHTDGA